MFRVLLIIFSQSISVMVKVQMMSHIKLLNTYSAVANITILAKSVIAQIYQHSTTKRNIQ